MKKFLTVLLLAAFAAGVWAQEFKINGEVKTGLIWSKPEDQINYPKERTTAGSKDDAGTGSGRFRINMEYSIENFGFKARLNMEGPTGGQWMPLWPYAFGYGNLLDDQLTFSIGKLGASPWGTGGPEMWKEAEEISSLGGMRVEIKPQAVPGLNVGFVINSFDDPTDIYPEREPITFLHILQESVLGAAYTHDLFHVRAAYRFDSLADQTREANHGNNGGKIVYRVEEKLIEQFLPSFNIWALGYWYGVGADESNRDFYEVQNWMFIQYAPELFTAQIRLGYYVVAKRQDFRIKPVFYLHLLDRLITVGGFFQYVQDFGDGKVVKDSPYYIMEFEPLVQLNMTPNSYIALAYNFKREYVAETQDHRAKKLLPLRQDQWVNFRVGMTF